MKKITFPVLLLSLSVSPVWGEDITSDNYANVDIYAAALENAAVVAPAPVKAVLPPTIAAPKLSREDNASLHLNILRDEVDKMTQVGFFGSMFSVNEELQQTLMQDIDLFLTIYSDLSITAHAMLLKGEMLAKQNQPEAASVAWLQTMYEFPKTDAARLAKDKVNDLIENDWDDEQEIIKPMLKSVPNKGVSDRLRKLINELYPIDDKDVVVALTLLQLDFLKRFSDDAHADEVQVLLAHNLGAESAESAIFSFKKLLALYPNSSYRPEAILAIADLQRMRLKEYDNAENNYKALINAYPEHKLTKNAYMSLALTQAEHLKKYADAVQTYKSVVSLYPEDKDALKAMQNMAKLQANKTNEPAQAVVTLRKLASVFHGFEATDALDDAIDIAHKALRDDNLVFAIREQLVRDYPNSDDAPKALFAMAEQKEEQGVVSESKRLYESLITKYPNHKLASKAKAKLQPK